MTLTAEIEGATIVMLGSLNPAIFHPSWFFQQGLIGKPDLDSAAVELVTPQLSVMSVSGMRLVVQPERFQIETMGVDMLGPARDLVVGAFRVLEHSPVTAIGLNHHAHYRADSESAWHAIGHRLAPKEVWADLIGQPGMLAVHMQGKREGSKAEYLRVKVEPSRQVKMGIYVGTNEHYANAKLPELLDLLSTEWEPSQQFARELGPKVIERCLQ